MKNFIKIIAVVVTALMFATGCEKGKEVNSACHDSEKDVNEIVQQKFIYKNITTQDIGKIHNLVLIQVRAKISRCKDSIKIHSLEEIYGLLYFTVNMFIDTNYNNVIKFSQIDNSLIELEKKNNLDKNDIVEIYEKMVNKFISTNYLSHDFADKFNTIIYEMIDFEDDIKVVKSNINKLSKIKTTNYNDELFLQTFVNIYAYSYSFWTSNYVNRDKSKDSFGLVAFADAVGGAVGGAMGSVVGSNAGGKVGGIVGGIFGTASVAVGVSALVDKELDPCSVCNPNCKCGCKPSNMATGIDNGMSEDLLNEFNINHIPIVIYDLY